MDMPSSTNSCARCGTPLDQRTLNGLCPRCVALDFFTPAPAEETAPEAHWLGGSYRRIGDYELIEEIARGGMGVVYRARQVSLGREVAVKMLLHGVLAGDTAIARFKAEASAVANLKHPNIVAIHEIGEHEGQHFFSMELVAGQTLAEKVREGPLPATQAATHLQRVAEAVGHAHERGVLHRDLKPSNVLVDENDQPRVTDFGLAKSSGSNSDLTMSGQVLGTPAYMSPEQAGGARFGPVDARSDVYSLGAVLYHLVTGRAPFTGEAITEILQQVTDVEPVAPRLLNPKLPRDLETICLKCLAKEPATRYASAQALADDLGRFLRGEPIAARPAGAVEKLWRWGRRKPALAAALGACAVILCAGVAGILWQLQQTEAARRLAVQNAKGEQAQRLEAQARLHQGEDLINFMLGDLSDRLEPVGRLDVLESAIAEVDKYYAALPVEQMIPESRGHRAKALFQIGAVRTSQGRFDAAITNYFAAIHAYTNLIAAYPANFQWQYDYARTLNDLGYACMRMEKISNALAAWEACLAVRERLVQQQPTNGFWLGAYAATAMNLGQSHRRQGHLEQAGGYLRIADQAFRQWVALEPGATLPKERLATGCGAMGQWFEAQGKLEEAARAEGEKIQILRELLQMDPAHTRRQAELANGLDLLGTLQEKQTNFDAALTTLSEGIALDESLMARDAANHDWQLNFVAILVERGQVLMGMNRPADALKDFQRVWDLSKPQAETVKQYPAWLRNWRQSLESGEQAERDLAMAAEAGGHPAEAEAHRHRAEELQAEGQALGNQAG